MGTRERRERERVSRRAAIVAVARELAEEQGWDAVTTRRLAERIEYSQPVLYSHFAGKDAIVAAVAREGFAELAGDIRSRTASAPDPSGGLEAAASAYLAFAREHPATYHAMVGAVIDLPFAAEDTPAELHDAFTALRAVVVALTGPDDDTDLRTELLWSTLHGLATLRQTARIPAEHQARRIALLVRTLGPDRTGATADV